jgi:hypothetical protein
MEMEGHEKSNEHSDYDEQYDRIMKRRHRCCMLPCWGIG